MLRCQVCFAEGAAVTADTNTILYCIGYRYHFPFLDLDELSVDDDDDWASVQSSQ
jgi:hypothetical protein